MAKAFLNPFRPGAGHMPPYLAGRSQESEEFRKLLKQDIILENLVLTGLRGVGKTVLLETFKPLAIQSEWLWIGTDLSESSSVSEENLATRLMADLAVVTGGIVIEERELTGFGLRPTTEMVRYTLNYEALSSLYGATPGLVVDKLKRVLETAWSYLQDTGKRGLIFAYDEAQNLADHAQDKQYPLSLLLDLFQSLQKKNIPYMLALTGLPTLFPKLVEARTYAERMFRVVTLDRLNEAESRQAVIKPMAGCPVQFSESSVNRVIQMSGGYPYFIQFICREAYDIIIQKLDSGDESLLIRINEILQKLDNDFFAGRWARVTDRQRDLLTVIASLEHADEEFTVIEVVEAAKKQLATPFSSSHVNQMLSAMCDRGLVYKNRHGKYCFAVPLLGQFIKRQAKLSTAR
jgi:hypothetical protein